MNIIDLFVSELDREVKRSRRALEMVPDNKRSWKPHEKSMEFGYLSDMVATIPTWLTMIVKQDDLDVAPRTARGQSGPSPGPVPSTSRRWKRQRVRREKR